ncbi:MAG TPA: hypothetical protein ENN23_02895 [Deltaproteobacteria bacterium]|nr:hypothetical protein [Deltaproteobacteria bacterium]
MTAKTNRQKGQEFQRWVKTYLEKLDYVVFNMPLTGRMTKGFYVSQKNDIFGCDLVARKKNQTLWIQATLHSNIKEREKEFRKYFEFINPEEHVQLWIKTKKEINIKELDLGQGFFDLGKIIRGKFYSLGAKGI